MAIKAVLPTTQLRTSATGPTISSGTGAPSNTTVTGVAGAAAGTPVAGSLYIRTDGTSGARVYWCYGSVWTAMTAP